MQITILGGGSVGYAIAETLCNGYHSITVVENNPQRAERFKELDVKLIVGSAADPGVLFTAGVATCDLCLAVTGVEEINVIAASIAKSRGAKRTVARIYSPYINNLGVFDYRDYFHIDRLVSLEQLTALELVRLVRRSQSQVLDLVSRGELEVQEIHIEENSPVIGVTLRELRLPAKVRVALLKRGGSAHLMTANDAFEKDDVISLTGTAEDINSVSKKYFNAKAPKAERVMIMGGGETGYYIAQALEHANFEVVLFERDKDRGEFLAKHLSKSVSVVQANGLSRRDLEENQIDSVDSFIACTGDDENNIMGAVEAKELGAKQVFAVVSRPDYAAIVKKLGIDRVVSPRTVMASRIRGLLNSGAVLMRTQLANQSDIEVIEVEVIPGSEACNKTIRNLGLPQQCLIAGINDQGFVLAPDADYTIKPGNLIIMLVHNQVFEQALEKFKV